jgi:hypothetical protein
MDQSVEVAGGRRSSSNSTATVRGEDSRGREKQSRSNNVTDRELPVFH